jgi:hypothetical protein
MTLFEKPLLPITMEVGPVLIEMDETDHSQAYITVGVSQKLLTNEELHLLFARLSLFMTTLNYEQNGWTRP